ncbi:MAG: sulfite exporter TauE/SafE family protein [Sulfitobacter sp.]
MADLWSALSLTPSDAIALAAICFVAGLVRGFTGFALSAFALTLAVLILPPVELIPVMWWLEITASLVMLRNGWDGADLGAALLLAAGSTLGLVIGLSLTTSIDPVLSRTIALYLLIGLALLQLAKVRIPHLASQTGTIGTGILAGIATGLAGVGGMVVALYVLARNDEPAKMRATLVAFLFLVSCTSLVTHLWFGTMNPTSALRGLAFVLPCVAGVLLGQRFFTPRFQPYYRPACLSLLIGLGTVSLLRSAL